MEKHIISYTTTDGCPVKIKQADAIGTASISDVYQKDAGCQEPRPPVTFGATLISNTYVDGVGRLVFDAPVTGIADCAFSNCENLKSIVIPSSVVEIGAEAFNSCANLLEVTLCEGLVEICRRAFDGCKALQSIEFPKSVLGIAEFAFSNCRSLLEIHIPEDVELDYGVFLGCDRLMSVTISKGVEFCNGNPFLGCKELVEFKGKYVSEDGRCLIVDGVLTSFAPFGIAAYTLPTGVTSIARGAFAYCDELQHVYIPNTVISISEIAFEMCSKLETITIPASVTKIGYEAFNGCNNIEKVFISDLKKWFGFDFDACCNSNPMHSGALLMLDGKPVTSIVVPDDITVINSMAFCGCKSLKCIFVSKSVNSIQDGAFMRCKSLEYVVMQEGLHEICYSAFEDCLMLRTINIPSTVTLIGILAFWNCSKLKDIYCRAIVPPNGGWGMFDDNAFERFIFVPEESVEEYKKSIAWSFYASRIIGYDFNRIQDA